MPAPTARRRDRQPISYRLSARDLLRNASELLGADDAARSVMVVFS